MLSEVFVGFFEKLPQELLCRGYLSGISSAIYLENSPEILLDFPPGGFFKVPQIFLQ